MLTKQDILYNLKEFYHVPKDKIIILSGASLVMQGIIKDTKDIDIAIPKEYYDKFSLTEIKGAFGVNIKCFGVFDIGYNLYYETDCVLVDEYKCATLQNVLNIKKKLNRKKDKKNYRIFRKYIEVKGVFMYGLVLGGGGAKGAYQVGCLKAFEELKIKFLAISGTSIGAVNGLFYLSNSLDVMEDKWKELNSKDFLTIEDDNLLNGIFGRTGFLKLIDEYIDFNKFYKSNIPLFITIAGNNGVKYVLLNNKKPDEVKKYIEAASAIPIVYSSVNIKGNYYVDGGVFDNLPETPLVRNNINKIISIPLDNSPSKYADIIISPSVDLGGLFDGTLNFSKNALANRLDLGYYDTLEILNNKFDLNLNNYNIKSQQMFIQEQLKLIKTTDKINQTMETLNKYLK